MSHAPKPSKRKPGRPRVKRGRRDAVLYVRVTPQLAAQIDATAEAAGRTRGAWVIDQLSAAVSPTDAACPPVAEETGHHGETVRK